MKINVEKSNVKEWLVILSKAKRGTQYQKLWKRVYRLVEVPSRKRYAVNLNKIEANSREGDNVIVPGKVLSTGKINHKINITAIEFSTEALRNLKEADCRIVHIRDMVNSKGIHVII